MSRTIRRSRKFNPIDRFYYVTDWGHGERIVPEKKELEKRLNKFHAEGNHGCQTAPNLFVKYLRRLHRKKDRVEINKINRDYEHEHSFKAYKKDALWDWF